MEKRPQWEKPELIVLVRSKPAEAVLQGCKTSGDATGYAMYNNNCLYTPKDEPSCSGVCSGTLLS